MHRLASAFILTSFLVGCGGGGSGSPAPSGGNPATNQAVLGPISGATINAYRLTSLTTSIEGPITAATSTTDLAAAGSFALTLSGIADDEWILVAVTGGEDIDADDDGILDPSSTLNNGTLYAVGKASTWKAGEGKITALSDIVWRYAQDQASNSTALESRLEALADWLIATDIDGDGTVDYDDLLRFNPRLASTQTALNYALLLPSGDFANPNHIDRLHSGDDDSAIETALRNRYGTAPWTPDTTPDSFSFTAENNLGLNQYTESNEISVSGINRATTISITNGEYSLNGGSYTTTAGTLNNGDSVQISLTSASDYGSAVTATLSIGGVDGTFVGTTYTLDATPDAFTFIDQTEAARSTEVESSTITISGINGAASISISNGEYSLNNGSYTANAGTINDGDTVKVKLTSPSSFATAATATLTIGGVSDSFDVSTVAYSAHSFLDAGGALGALGVPMVYINAAGQSFTQGCHNSGLGENGVNDDPDCSFDEGPERNITFANSFAISAHEVTFDAWDACVADGGCSHTPSDEDWGRATRPVINVSYDDITSGFIPWLNSKTGLTFRLPTESEWEYAARAGTTTPFSTGVTLDCSSDANCIGSSVGGTAVVGSYPANAYSLYDMQGNVGEWVEDTYNSDYSVSPIDGSANNSGGSNKVTRGGSWLGSSEDQRVTNRGDRDPSFRWDILGLRLVQDLSGG